MHFIGTRQFLYCFSQKLISNSELWLNRRSKKNERNGKMGKLCFRYRLVSFFRLKGIFFRFIQENPEKVSNPPISNNDITARFGNLLAYVNILESVTKVQSESISKLLKVIKNKDLINRNLEIQAYLINRLLDELATERKRRQDEIAELKGTIAEQSRTVAEQSRTIADLKESISELNKKSEIQ